MSWVCLMYHDVSPADVRRGGGPERFTVPLSSLELMLDTIKERGFVGSSLAEALRPHTARPVGITFDDGNTGQFEHAVPALRERGMTATFFVATDWVGRPGFMTWDQLRQLVEWGMSVQSHTNSHPYLSELSDHQLRSELADSKAKLDTELNQDTSQLALPSGNAPRWGSRRHLTDLGYKVVATSRWGWNTHETRSSSPAHVRWIRRCTVPDELDSELAGRIVEGDRTLAIMKYSREALLNGLRALVGPSRYARWRRRWLDTLAR